MIIAFLANSGCDVSDLMADTVSAGHASLLCRKACTNPGTQASLKINDIREFGILQSLCCHSTSSAHLA